MVKCSLCKKPCKENLLNLCPACLDKNPGLTEDKLTLTITAGISAGISHWPSMFSRELIAEKIAEGTERAITKLIASGNSAPTIALWDSIENGVAKGFDEVIRESLRGVKKLEKAKNRRDQR